MTREFAREPGLKSITISHFKSLRDQISIEFAPVTLLFGPNSAGKSAVYDAIDIVGLVLRGEGGADDRIRYGAFRQDGQYESNPAFSVELVGVFGEVPTVDLGAIVLSSQIPDLLRDSERNFLFSEKPVVISLQMGFDKGGGLDQLCVSIDGCLALKYCQDQESRLELFDAAFEGLLTEFADDFGADSTHPQVFSFQGDVYFSDGEFFVPQIDTTGGYDQALLTVSNYIVRRVAELYGYHGLVLADRGTIPIAVTSQVCALGSAGSGRFGRFRGIPPSFTAVPIVRQESPELAPYDDIFSELAFSRMEAHLAESISRGRGSIASDVDGGAEVADDPDRLQNSHQPTLQNLLRLAEDVGFALADERRGRARLVEPLHEFVNRCLMDHLFKDRGYVINYDICEITPSATLLRDEARPEVAPRYYTERGWVAALVLCTLRDNGGRSLRFSDVGTGISCVIPALTALYSDWCFIQQPELHLHPALQASLGDVAIEAASRFGNISVLETHSEYILLRCLRRIRQTSAGALHLGDSLRFRADMLAVYYFDPQPDGSTRVKRIRLTDHGDFLDHWPRGFFDERGEELFGE